jgi:hypothetical protein
VKTRRKILVWLLISLLLYMASSTVFIRVPQGIRALVPVDVEAPARRPRIIMEIYVSRDPTMNRMGKVAYYPLVRLGEAVGLWRFVDDAPWGNGPCLLLYVADLLCGQPTS